MSYPEERLSTASDWFEKYSNSFDTNTDLDSDHCKSKAENILNDIGYTFCGAGTYRRVYADDSKVIKFGLDKQGKKENSSEIKNYSRISEAEIKDIHDEGYCNGVKYIAEIYTYETGSNRWIIMEKVTVTGNNVSAEIANKVEESFKSAGIYIDEIFPANMGRLNGVPVVFDYAGT